MNRRPGFRNFGRGVRRGRAKSGFFGWVALLVVVGLLGPMLVAVDVAPVWNVPTSSENSVGGTGSSGTAAEPAEVNFDVGVERTGEAAEVAAGGLVPAALAHAHTQPGGGCTYGRWSSGRCKACPSGQVWRTGRGCVSTTTTTNAPTTTTTVSRSCPAGQTYYSSYGGCRPSSCANGRTSTGYCRACADPTHLRSGGRCVPKTRPSPGDPSCPSGQLYYGSYGGCRPANCSLGRTSSGYCRSCPSGQSYYSSYGGCRPSSCSNGRSSTGYCRSCPSGQTYYSSYDGCRPSSCSNGRSSTGYCRACVDPTHQKVGGRCVPKTRPSPGDPSCPSGQLYYGSYGGCRPRSCPGGRTGSGYCRAVSPPTPRPSPPTGTTTTTSTTSATTTTTTTTTTTATTTTTVSTSNTAITTACDGSVGHFPFNAPTTVLTTLPFGIVDITSSTSTWEDAIGATTTTLSSTSTTIPKLVPIVAINQESSSQQSSASNPCPENVSSFYYNLLCTVYAADQGASFYLNLGKSDFGNCPVLGIFHAVRNYDPRLVTNTALYNKYGFVAVRQDGDCSGAADSGVFFDFLIPCQSHDYCYDLRRAGFSNTVSDTDCDNIFLDMMQADCDIRSPRHMRYCSNRAFAYHLVVKTPIAGTADPGPGLVQLRNVNTNLCMTVPDNRKDNDVQLIQGNCEGAKNQIFRMHSLLNSEIGNALFIIIPEHSRKSSTVTKPSKRSCIRMIDTWSSNSWRIVQWECRGSLIHRSMKFSIESVGNNYYTILSLSGRCIRPTNVLSNARIVGDSCINYITALDGQDILYWRIENVNL